MSVNSTPDIGSYDPDKARVSSLPWSFERLGIDGATPVPALFIVAKALMEHRANHHKHAASLIDKADPEKGLHFPKLGDSRSQERLLCRFKMNPLGAMGLRYALVLGGASCIYGWVPERRDAIRVIAERIRVKELVYADNEAPPLQSWFELTATASSSHFELAPNPETLMYRRGQLFEAALLEGMPLQPMLDEAARTAETSP